VKFALCQTPQPANIQAGIATIDTALGDARADNVDVVVFPEAYLPGYTKVTTTPPADWAATLDKLAQLCGSHAVGLAIGLPEFTDTQVFNAAYVFDATGAIIAKHRKIQLFGPDEAAIYTAGDTYTTFELNGIKMGLLICYDIEFSEHVRAMARQGVQAILVPTANMMPFVNVCQIIVPARAADNKLTIVYANYCGSADHLDFAGLSGIIGPDGFALAPIGTDAGLFAAAMPTGMTAHNIPLSTQLDDFRPVQPPKENR
jgi:predicted amidohydrolase